MKMSEAIHVDILSDDDEDGGKRNDTVDLSSPFTIRSKKKQRTTNWNNPSTVLIIEDDDDDTTPYRPSKSTPSFVSMSDFSFVKCSSSRLDLTPSMVAETPASELPRYSVPIVRCTKANADLQSCSSSIIDHNKDGEA